MPWPTVPLGQVARVERTGVDPSSVAHGTPYVGLENVERGGRLVNVAVSSPGELASTKFRFSEHHVLFGKLRPNLAKVAQPSFAGICSTDILPVRPGERLDRRYLAHWLLAPDTVALATSRAAGANLPRLSPAELLNFELPLPPIEEQRRIADILDRANALRAKRREALVLLDDLTQSIFIEMFGDPLTNPKCLPVMTLGEIGTLDRGVSRHRPRNDPRLLGGAYPLIQTGDVAKSRGRISSFLATYSEHGLAQSKLWPAGTLCITIAANIAKTGILRFAACFPDSVVGFVADEPITLYVQSWLGFMQQKLEAAAPMSAQRNINLALLRSLPIPVPPAVLLAEFTSRLKEIERLRDATGGGQAQMDALFVSLESRAFDGLL